jgi:hypothetical protein
VDVLAAVVADEQPLELMQPGEGAFDDPAVAAQAGAVHGSAAGDLRCDPAPSQLAAVLVVVVAAVGADPVRASPWPAGLAGDRRHPVEQRQQLRDVMPIAARDRPGERQPGRVYEQVMLGAVSGSVNWARARRRAPFFACT